MLSQEIIIIINYFSSSTPPSSLTPSSVLTFRVLHTWMGLYETTEIEREEFLPLSQLSFSLAFSKDNFSAMIKFSPASSSIHPIQRVSMNIYDISDEEQVKNLSHPLGLLRLPPSCQSLTWASIRYSWSSSECLQPSSPSYSGWFYFQLVLLPFTHFPAPYFLKENSQAVLKPYVNYTRKATRFSKCTSYVGNYNTS